MISIIIPTLNRAESLNRTLKSLVAQNFTTNNYEILVIDNGSNDETKSVYNKNYDEHPNHQIRYIYEPEPGLLSGRHRGALEAKGEILVFVDDDIEADVNWLQAIKQSFEDATVQIVGGRNLPDFEVEPPKWLEWFWIEHPYGKLCSELSLLDFGDQVRDIDPNYVWGLNFSIRKVALFELGGFHPDCIPKHLQCFQGDGETGLTQKAKLKGYRAIYQPNALVFHSVSQERMTYEYFDRRYFYQGISDSYSFLRQSQGQLNQGSLIDKIKIILKVFQKIARKLMIHKQEHNALKGRFISAYQRGYQFHKKAVMKNPQLLDWVLKPNYWNYTLPQINITHD